MTLAPPKTLRFGVMCSGTTFPAWQARCEPQARWLSTNHLVGAGYWVWLIPLGSGATSVGIVTDETIHPQSSSHLDIRIA